MLPKKGYLIPRARKVDMIPQIWNGYSETGRGTLNFYPKKIHNIHYFFENRGSTIVYIEKEMQECGQAVLRRFLADKNFISTVQKNHSRLGKAAENYAWNILKKISGLGTRGIFPVLKLIQGHWINFDQANVSSWFLGGEALKEYLLKIFQTKHPLAADEIETLFAANTLSLPSQEELQTFQLALKLKNGARIEKNLTGLVEQFGWMPYGYDGPVFWDRAYFMKKVNSLAKSPPNLLKKKIHNIFKNTKNTIARQKTIIKKHAIDKKLVRLLNIIQALIVLTDERKKIQYLLHYAFHEVLKKLAPLSGLTIDELKYLDVGEAQKMYREKKISFWKKVARKRINGLTYLHIADGKIKKIITSTKVKNIKSKYVEKLKILKELFGQIGNKTSNPVVTGKVRVLMSTKEINQMKQGEILVTWMTSPDFVPAMRKAKAVVTDEGGITCHAAIVSRELGIPAIVGTGIATKTFKNGDMVEVDADKGIVRKI